MSSILQFLGNNIQLVAIGGSLIICPCYLVYKMFHLKAERFPTTIRYDMQFQRFKEGLRQKGSINKKGF